MPIIQIHMFEGRTIEKKRKLAQEVTKAVASSLEIAEDQVRIIISEMNKDHYAVAGVLKSDSESQATQKALA